MVRQANSSSRYLCEEVQGVSSISVGKLCKVLYKSQHGSCGGCCSLHLCNEDPSVPKEATYRVSGTSKEARQAVCTSSSSRAVLGRVLKSTSQPAW